jgi:hypothetical protein
MDYNGGTALYKYQWDYIHDPQTMLFAWAEEEEEGAMALNIIDAIKENNRLGLNSLKISDTWKKEESIQINLENLEIITVATKILKPKTTINTRAYTTEAIAQTEEVKVYFFDQYPITTDQQPVVTFQLAKAKLDKFLRYLYLSDLQISGDVHFNGEYYIASIKKEPRMPRLKFEFGNTTGKEIELSYSLMYDLKYRYMGKEYRITDKLEKNGIKIKGNEYSIDWGNAFQGGDLTIRWKIDTTEKMEKIMIRGENPEFSAVKSYGESIGTVKYWFFWDIIGRESIRRQFMNQGEYKLIEGKTYDYSSHNSEQKGLPLWGGPKGFGFAQLDNWGSKENPKECTTLQRWNWKENIKGAIEVIESKINEISNNKNMKDLVNLIIIKNDSAQLEDLQIGNVTFTWANSSLFPNFDIGRSLPAGKRSIFDANLIKYYNGGLLFEGYEKVIEKKYDKMQNAEIEKTYYRIKISNNLKYLNDVYNNK